MQFLVGSPTPTHEARILVGSPDDIERAIRQIREEWGDEVPIKLSAMTADRRTVKVPIGDDTLTLVYKPSSVNAVQEARENEERSKGQHLLSQARSLNEILLSWDVVDDANKPVPVTEELLKTFGLDVLQAMTRAILNDLLPNRQTRTESPDGSSATGD